MILFFKAGEIPVGAEERELRPKQEKIKLLGVLVVVLETVGRPATSSISSARASRVESIPGLGDGELFDGAPLGPNNKVVEAHRGDFVM